jgi:hypothetical protein
VNQFNKRKYENAKEYKFYEEGTGRVTDSQKGDVDIL